MMKSELKQLCQELQLKTPFEQINPGELEAVLNFLKLEKDFRQQYRLKRLLSSCGIRASQIKTFEQFDWSFNPKIPKQDILTFRNSNWTQEGANLVLIGEAGLGKSHLAKAICYEAILAGLSTYFISVFDLISRIKRSPVPTNKIDFYGKNIKVLCLDELGYTYHQKEDVDIIFQIISKRSELLPTIITTNLPPKQWGSIFSGAAASAILDRLCFKGKFIVLEGRSYRLRSKLK